MRMSNPTPEPTFSPRGAVDLSALNRPQSPPPGEPGGAPTAGGFVVDVTDANFEQTVKDSTKHVVVMLLWKPTDQANAELATTLGRIAEEYAGRFLLGRLDVDAYPQIAAAFQPQGVPTVVAVLQGQPLPLFAGAASEEQVRGVLDQVFAAAEQNGVTGRVAGAGDAAGEEEPAEPVEEPLPPLHQEAYDAIERDDLEAAEAAYAKAIKQDPKDADAIAGRAQVRLMRRTRGADLQQVRQAAADAPADVSAQLAVADMDMLGGKVDDALDRLMQLLPASDGDDKEALRARLVDYFEVVGPTDPRVAKARRRLAMYLY
ncbi:tetratricopeptide repeat protein [Isoptericola chiayiensis]|uniref:Tetratricopeptide repeat protein n=2 Tax=Isoptericola chiayiensis TaxID=579446 RepID=A0ABP8Y706_9MICO